MNFMELSSILPLEVNAKEAYSAALKCALLSEHLEKRSQELSKLSQEVSVHSPTGCSPKYIEKLLQALIKTLKRHLKDPHKYPFINNFKQTDQEFWDVLMRFSTYLNSIPNDMVQQRVGNIEAVIMIFSKYAMQAQPTSNEQASILQKGTVPAENLDKFCGIIRRLLDNEFKPHPAYPTTLRRLIQCVESSQGDGTPVLSYAQSLVLHLQKLFSCPDIDHLKLVAGYKPICNGHSSFQDLKKCLMHLTKNLQPYFPPDEYLTADDFANYKAQERAELSQLIAAMSLRDPDLVSCYIESNAFSSDDYREKPYTIIPKNPRNIYRALTIVITQKELVETDDTSAPSDASLALLSECALRWRLGTTFRLIANLEAAAHFFGTGNLRFRCFGGELLPSPKVYQTASL
ncbi:hypothetical protein DSO57_1034449 [Entomophthora muscae]|uniref:Uncharacterized protein n=1 Tax=Entomophthora muscae TaxID=34485 RepID=A0ACC2TYK7_9FUNG|nr:hypothetical protein DSO57_1034449 [Entomophthora muscae]